MPKTLLQKLNKLNFLQVSYFLFFLLLPFVYTQSVMDPVLVPRQLYVSLFLLIIWSYILLAYRNKVSIAQLNKPTFYFLISYSALIIFSFASIIWSNTASEGINVSTKYLVIYLFFITTYLLLNLKLISHHEIVKGIIAFLIISIGYGINDLVFLISNNINILTNSRILTATFANKNLFASILVLNIWAIFSCQLKPLFKYILLVFVLALIIFTQSKTVVAVTVFIFSSIAFRQLKLSFPAKKSDLIFGISIALVIAVIAIPSIHRLPNLTNTHTLSTRLFLWKNSFDMIREYPLGVGAGNWQFIFPKYGLWMTDVQAIKDGYIQYHTPHNDFFWILNELGLHGLIAYGLMFSIVILILVKVARKQPDNSPFLLLITIIGYTIIAFFDFPLERIEHQVILFSLFALALTRPEIQAEIQKKMHFKKLSLAILSLIVFSIPVGVLRLKGELCTKEFLYLDKKKHANFVIKKCEEAKSFVYKVDPVTMPIDWYKGIAYFYQHKLDSSEASFKSAAKFAPNNLQVLNNLGNIYFFRGDTLNANQCFQKVRQLSPNGRIRNLKP